MYKVKKVLKKECIRKVTFGSNVFNVLKTISDIAQEAARKHGKRLKSVGG